MHHHQSKAHTTTESEKYIKNINRKESLEFSTKHYLASAEKLQSDNFVRTEHLLLGRRHTGRPSAVNVAHRLNKLTYMPCSHIYKTSNCPIHI